MFKRFLAIILCVSALTMILSACEPSDEYMKEYIDNYLNEHLDEYLESHLPKTEATECETKAETTTDPETETETASSIPTDVFVERVEITNEGQKYSPDQGDYIVVLPNENGERKIQIEYTVYPENASDKTVEFKYEESQVATVDENGLVVFYEPGMLRVTVVASNNEDIYDTLLIISP